MALTLFNRSMPADRAARWEKTRQRGKWRFAFLNGVLSWGGFMAITMSLLQHGRRPDLDFWSRILPMCLGIYSIGGLLFGLSTWRSNERAYSKFKKENEEQLPSSNS